MSYAKKKFEGEFLNYYNVIKSHGKTSVAEIYNYKPVAQTIKGLPWEGNTKESICEQIGTIDNYCNKIYLFTDNIVKKAKIIYGIFFSELCLLKSTIEKYNSTIDEYESLQSQLAYALQMEQENEG